MLSGLSRNNRQWLAEHLVEAEEVESAQQRKRDEELVRKPFKLARNVAGVIGSAVAAGILLSFCG